MVRPFISLFSFLVLLLSLCANVASASTTKLSYEAYGALPERSMFRISPSGKRVSYRQVEDDKDYMVVMDLETKEFLSFIDASAIVPENAYFIDEDRIVFVTISNQVLYGYRGRHEISSAYSYNVESKDLHSLLDPGFGIYTGQTNLGRIVGISGDGEYAYMPAWESSGTFSLMKSKLDKKHKARRMKRGKYDVIDFFVNDNDGMLARERYDNKENLHRIEAMIDGRWKEIHRETTKYRTKSFVGVTPDRQSLVLLDRDKKHGRVAYYTMALSDGKISGPLFNHADKDVERVITNINRVVYGVEYSGFKPSYEFFESSISDKLNQLAADYPDNVIRLVDHTPDWSKMVLYATGAGSSGDYLLFDGKAISKLSSARSKFTAEHVHQVSEFRYTARDGFKIPTLVTLPKVEKVENLPAIILPHGGPESYDKMKFDWLAQYFASQGYLVVQPQFRGSTGFGPDHLFKGRGEWGRKMQDDLTDAVANLVEKKYVDLDKVCIVGASYGGYAALAGAAFTPDLYKCVVAINGVSDIDRMMRTERKEYGKHHWVVSYWQDVISKGEVDEKHLAQISPINHVKAIKSPILLIHGEYDEVVSVKQSEEMAEELEDANKQVKFVELEKGDHYLSRGKNRQLALKEIHQFVSEHLK